MIRLTDIDKYYVDGETEKVALRHINLTFEIGEYICVQGNSGSGKTTLFKILGLLEEPTTGDYHFRDKNFSNLTNKQLLSNRKGLIGLSLEQDMLIEDLDIGENIALPLYYMNISKNERSKMVNTILENFNLTHKKKLLPKQLTQLQRQVVSIARATVSNPQLLLIDEPTSRLNSSESEEIMTMIEKINRQNTTIIVFTQSVSIAQKADRCIYLSDGHLVNAPTL